jgi:tRNA pseudouridine55 synthase
MAKCASRCAPRMRALTFARLPFNLAAEATPWPLAFACAAPSPKFSKKFSLQLMTRSPQIDGVLLVDKATGMTSHDVVAIARRQLRAAGVEKVGHCGTLDPLATGLLILTIGRGTKIQDLLMSEDKEYVGKLRLGEVTDSQDADGEVTESKAVPALAREQIEAAFAKFHGDFYQTPPMVSAIKKDGVPLYKLARQGKTVEREPRFVHVFAHEILAVHPLEVEFRVVCSKGFYVRTYAHDIGQELGCGAHLAALRRTKSGKFAVDNAVTVPELQGAAPADLTKRMLSLPQVSILRGA